MKKSTILKGLIALGMGAYAYRKISGLQEENEQLRDENLTLKGKVETGEKQYSLTVRELNNANYQLGKVIGSRKTR